MNNISEVIISVIGAIASAGGIAGIIGVKTTKTHSKYKVDIDIKVAKLEEKVKGLSDNIYPMLKEIKQDIRDLRNEVGNKE